MRVHAYMYACVHACACMCAHVCVCVCVWCDVMRVSVCVRDTGLL